MKLDQIVNDITYLILGLNKFEKKLLRNQSYREKSIPKWKQNSGLSWTLTKKVLTNLEIYDGQRIREIITRLVENNKELFSSDDCFISPFGQEGKSGGNVYYDFRHTNFVREDKFKNIYELSSLPPNSKIVFVDDLIGTGTQSLTFIQEKINLFAKQSHQTYLLSICATPEGIEHVEQNSNFKVLAGIRLDSDQYQFTNQNCEIFTDSEKSTLIELNKSLTGRAGTNFNQGLLLAFYYSTPNNCMPIIWKEGYKYKDQNNNDKKWAALLPRKY